MRGSDKIKYLTTCGLYLRESFAKDFNQLFLGVSFFLNICAANVKRHIKVVHQGVKDFQCPHCERSFAKAETLKHHVMTHTGEKPHACRECGKRFIQPTALNTHMKTHFKSK